MAVALLPALPPEPPVTPPRAPAQVPLRVIEWWAQHTIEAPEKNNPRHLKKRCRCRTRCRCPQPPTWKKGDRRRCLHRKVCSCLVADILFKAKSIGTPPLTAYEKGERKRDREYMWKYRDERPKTRGDCKDGYRPCPFVSCKWNLYLDVNPENGSIKYNFPMLRPWNLKETCALDVADRGGTTLEEVGDITNISMERIRQVEVDGAAKLREVLEWVQDAPEGEEG